MNPNDRKQLSIKFDNFLKDKIYVSIFFSILFKLKKKILFLKYLISN